MFVTAYTRVRAFVSRNLVVCLPLPPAAFVGYLALRDAPLALRAGPVFAGFSMACVLLQATHYAGPLGADANMKWTLVGTAAIMGVLAVLLAFMMVETSNNGPRAAGGAWISFSLTLCATVADWRPLPGRTTRSRERPPGEPTRHA